MEQELEPFLNSADYAGPVIANVYSMIIHAGEFAGTEADEMRSSHILRRER